MAQHTTPENHTKKSGSAQSHPLQTARVTREHPEPLTLCGFWVQRTRCAPVAVQGWWVPFPRGEPGWEPAPGPPAASPAQPSPRAVALPIHAAAQWESLMERPPRKSFSNIRESHHRGSQRAVFNMRSTLKSGTSVGFFRSP